MRLSASGSLIHFTQSVVLPCSDIPLYIEKSLSTITCCRFENGNSKKTVYTWGWVHIDWGVSTGTPSQYAGHFRTTHMHFTLLIKSEYYQLPSLNVYNTKICIGNMITCRIVIDVQLIKLVQYHICLKLLKLVSQYKLFHNDHPIVQGTHMAKNISWIGANRWYITDEGDNNKYTRTQFKLHAYLVETFNSTKSFINTKICAFESLKYTVDLSIYSYPAVQVNISPSYWPSVAPFTNMD